MRPVLFITIIFLCTVTLSGCFSGDPENVKAFKYPNQAEVTSDEYILQPPDQVTVIATKVPELMGTSGRLGQTQQIRPDGIISFEGVGEIQVAGKTPKEVAKIIADKVSALYKLTGDYPVNVQVTNMSKYYYIIGQVQRPGAQIFTGRETTLSAIAKAIPTSRAWEEQIQVIRPAIGQSTAKIFPLNFKKMAEHGDMTNNVLLQEGDIIYVPPTVLAWIGLKLEEIVGPLRQGASAVTMMAGTP